MLIIYIFLLVNHIFLLINLLIMLKTGNVSS
nr:MAG TPA: hypothetical protein [Siphoviridae sp. ctZCl11]